MAVHSLAWMMLAAFLVANAAASPLQKTSSHDEHELSPADEHELSPADEHELSPAEGSGGEESPQPESEVPVVDLSFFHNSEVKAEDIEEILGDDFSDNPDVAVLEVNLDENDQVNENKETSTEFGEQAFQFSKEVLTDENIETTFLGTMKHNTATSQATEEPMYGTEAGTTGIFSNNEPTTTTTSAATSTSIQTTTRSQTISSSSNDATIQPLTETTFLQDLQSSSTKETTPPTQAPAISTTTKQTTQPPTTKETTPPTKQPSISTTTMKTTTLDPINVDPSENFVEFERLFQMRLWKQAEFDSDDIVDVVTNFIYKRNPMLQLLLSICFVHPKCYSLEDVYINNVVDHKENSLSETGALVQKLLREKRREAARNIIIDLLLEVQVEIKQKMFHYFTTEVARRGKSVEITKTIIDSVKVIWEKTNDDLESAKVSIRELFYLLPLESDTEISAIVQMCEATQKITPFVDSQYKAAILDKTNNKRQSRNFGVWDDILNF